MSKFPSIVIGEFRYTLTDYRVEKTNLLTGEYEISGLEFKHDDFEFGNLLELLWISYTNAERDINE